MATINELKEALKEKLESKGVLQDMKARLRAEVFHALDDQQETARPEPSAEASVINELIREYLTFHKLKHTVSVFIPDAGQPEQPPFDRRFLAQRFNVVEDGNSRKLPLLYAILAQAEKYTPE